ncbi:ROK family protein [Vagococcus sp. DIV0080]|uniref:ROK family protein n=1 Tax=Candidatus Vagococcus giribetii TaxID=2230876 RepID=A0ABS3HVK8_9ENTE|nr:ROK family protein [Vagococcus sp. DIV0080]MBO0477794.1 ROK family protein [Vagococcus sp. DIV0080]
MSETNNHFLSIDIGGTFIKHALINRSGQIIFVKKEVTPDNLEAFKDLLITILDQYKGQIKATAISCPGQIDSKEGVVYHGGALTFLHTFRLKEFVESHNNLPCGLMNDGKSAALAELWLGQLKGIENGGVMTLGTGVGGGIVLNGSLFQGAHFQAAELSFMLLSVESPLNMNEIAGMKGSAVNFIHQAATLLKLDDLLDGKTVFKELENKNELIYPLFEDYCLGVVTIMMNMQSVVDLERVAIGGGISAQPILVEEIRRQYKKVLASSPLFSSMLTPVEIVPCHFRNEAGLLGALYHLLEELDGQ